MKCLVFICLIALLTAPTYALPAFPGAEGYASDITGGRGGRVMIVTNLNSRGPGSFAEALTTREPRIVVFRVSGVIDLSPPGVPEIRQTDSLYNHITIAGQTSPGGITITTSATCGNIWGGYTSTQVNNYVIRFIRFRADSIKGDHAFGWYLAHHFILDHCDFSGGLDECLDLMRCYDFTVQWCTISNASPYASLTSGWCSSSNPAQAYGPLIAYNPFYHHSFHHNLIANHRKRGPEYSWVEGYAPDSGKLDFRNNVIYNIEQYGTAFWGLDDTAFAQVNVVGNYWKAGPTGLNFLPVNSVKAVRIYANNNFWDAPAKQNARPMAGDADTIFQTAYGAGPTLVTTPWNLPAVTTHTPQEAYDTVLALAGVVPHDSLNRRVAEDVRNGTGRIGEMDEPFNVKGPRPPDDSDMDGMPDYWETAVSLNPNSAADATGDFDGSGYTNIEKYINDLALVLLGRDPLYSGTGIDSVKAGVWRRGHIRITVTDSVTGLPVSGVNIQVLDTNDVVMSNAVTGAAGVCVFSEDAGQYFLDLSRNQYRADPPVSAVVTQGETLAVAVALTPYAALGIRFVPQRLTLGWDRTETLRVMKVYPDNSMLPMTETLNWTVSPSNLGAVDTAGVLTTAANNGSAKVIAVWAAAGFTDTLDLTVGPSLLFVDFGATQAANSYGLEGWDSTFKDIYARYTSEGPAGIRGSNNAYNFQGVRTRDSLYAYTFAAGDTLKAWWYNHTAGDTITCTPRISFMRQGRIGGGAEWDSMSTLILQPKETGASVLVFDDASAGTYYLVNANSNYSPAGDTAELVCDKIELAFAGTGVGIEGPAPWAGDVAGIGAAPNPFNPATRIFVRRPAGMRTPAPAVRISDFRGKTIAVLGRPQTRPAYYEFVWDARERPSGVYIAAVRMGKNLLVKKLILMR
jgi:hypothetical protein